ncbi:MAG TPA: hypothetical protein VHO25_05190 [Polyangiaceae bacterium]|nr:hypothetical protein [Polyangiaceae bacterium]
MLGNDTAASCCGRTGAGRTSSTGACAGTAGAATGAAGGATGADTGSRATLGSPGRFGAAGIETGTGTANDGFETTGGAAERALGGGGGAFEPGRTNFGRSDGGGGGTDRGAAGAPSLDSSFALASSLEASGFASSGVSGTARPAATGGFKGPPGDSAAGAFSGARTAGA